MQIELTKIKYFFVRLANVNNHIFSQQPLTEFEKNFIQPEEVERQLTIRYYQSNGSQTKNDIHFIINNIFAYDVDNICFKDIQFSVKAINTLVSKINGDQKRHNKLMFCQCTFDLQTLKELAKNLVKNHYLKFISFAGCQFVPTKPNKSEECTRYLQYLINLFQKCPNLEAVDFGGTRTGFNQGRWNQLLIFLCSKKSHVFHINLQDIFSISKRAAFKNIECGNIATLGLTIDKNIDQVFLHTLQCFPNVKNLLLNVKILWLAGKRTMTNDVKNFLQNHKTLESLTIAKGMGDGVTRLLLQSLPKSRTFKRLKLNFVMRSEQEIALLRKYLVNCNLTHLKFSCGPQLTKNRLTGCMNDFMNDLAKCKTLNCLKYEFLYGVTVYPADNSRLETWWLENNISLTSLIFNNFHLHKVEKRNLLLTPGNRRTMFKGFVVALWPLIGCNVYVYLWIINFIEPYNLLSDATKVEDLNRIVASIQSVKLKTMCEK